MGEQTANKPDEERGPESDRKREDPDQKLLIAIASGDYTTALCLCARDHGEALGRLCTSLLGSTSDADDLVQDTLLDAHAGFDGFKPEHSPRAWLFGIARRKCARHLERKASQHQKLTLVHDATRSDSDELLLQRERARQAREALFEIRPSDREALVMRYVGDLSFRELGQACGVKEATARKRVSRALMKLRDIVKGKENAR